jgi:hypothetical protein
MKLLRFPLKHLSTVIMEYLMETEKHSLRQQLLNMGILVNRFLESVAMVNFLEIPVLRTLLVVYDQLKVVQ